MSEGFDLLGFRIQWKPRRGTEKWYVYTFIADRPVRSLKAKIRALTHRTSQQDLGYVLARLNMVMHGWARFFRHAVAKQTFSTLDYFTWRRVARMLMERHHWGWKEFRRPTGTGGRSPTAGLSCGGSTRYRSPCIGTAAARSPAPGPCQNTPDGRNRGEPVAPRGARRVRRAAGRNGPAATLEPRSRPTQRDRGPAGCSLPKAAPGPGPGERGLGTPMW